MITKTAWKNVWRNRVRSFVVIASVTIGVFAGVFAVAMMNGAIDQRVEEALNNETSHIQLTHKDFRSNNDLSCFIDNTDDIIHKLQYTRGVNSVISRLVVVGMANTATKSAGIMISGIEPEAEKDVFRLYEELDTTTGDYFDDPGRFDLAYIGEDLAKELNIIRYIISDEAISSLEEKGAGGGIISALETVKNVRFNNEKTFRKNIRSLLTADELKDFGGDILELSRSFRPRAKLTLTFIDKDNNQTGGVFRVAGLYDISNSMYESSQVFIKDEALRDLVGLPEDKSHTIIVRLDDVDDTKEMTELIKADYPDLEVMNWKDIQPDLSMMSEMAEAMYGFFMALILAALAFGIVNTMLMVVLERTKELGMLTAIGMNKKKVFRMIMTESVFLSLTGGITGMLISWFIVSLTNRKGINFASIQEGFESMGFSSHIFPSIDAGFFFIVTVLIIITGVLSSVYPALKALKLDPADALRTE